ncbi:DUF308 domain-containing protein [Rhodohalobacter sp.]|uniref:DUF308 domain-containing protein n=1 Tax=Rhodohalobacter sp. TaxID=1974210 RepID=UPI002ACE12EE|nr:DUF308 domain-containing protein [Rhodohalobacter sp.]MDZ7754960.1 hypothetical protein [Rhodohalobacter sp.]
MQFHFQISSTQQKSREHQVLTALLALVTGALVLMYPNFLYLIAGGYLVALGLMFMYARVPAFISGFPIVAGVLIFIFPELIPYTFALFLGFFGLIMLMGFQFAIMGFLTLIIAVLILMNPDSIAYFIAAFMLLYGISNLIRLFQNRNNQGRDDDHDPDVIVH